MEQSNRTDWKDKSSREQTLTYEEECTTETKGEWIKRKVLLKTVSVVLLVLCFETREVRSSGPANKELNPPPPILRLLIKSKLSWKLVLDCVKCYLKLTLCFHGLNSLRKSLENDVKPDVLRFQVSENGGSLDQAVHCFQKGETWVVVERVNDKQFGIESCTQNRPLGRERDGSVKCLKGIDLSKWMQNNLSWDPNNRFGINPMNFISA